MKKQKKESVSPFFWAFKTLYNWKYIWLDGYMIIVLFLFHQHFWTGGLHPIPQEAFETYWMILGAYLIVKEGMRWGMLGLKTRRGWISVFLWIASISIFFLTMAQYPDVYTELPPGMKKTTLVVVFGFLGITALKKAFMDHWAAYAQKVTAEEGKKN